MGDEWDDEGSGPVISECAFIDQGRNFGRGRGFVPQTAAIVGKGNDPDEWDETSGTTLGYANNSNDYGGGRGGNRGRGGRGGERGRRNDDGGFGGSRGYNRDDNEDGGGGRRGGYNRDNDGDGGRRGRGGGRGGYRGGRNDDGEDGGGYRSHRKDDESGGGVGDDGDKKDEKPREMYIPPEPTENEEEMFGDGITSGINFNKYDSIQVKVTGENKPEPIETFEAAGLRQFVLDNVKKSGYLKPTPVQRYALPIVMAGRDLMACAQTGSGKTAAFLLPIVHVLLSDPHDMVIDSEGVEPHAIIISPTRELTIQIHEQARKFSHGSIVRAVVAYGGTAAFHQAKTLMAGCHILVATPGRLMDYVNRGRVRFSSLRFMVLDEADRMLDMGFMPEVERMMNHPTMVPTGQRQTLMFSATFPEDIQRLAAKFLENYLFLAVGIVGGACADVEQRFYQLTKFEKRPKLVELLQEEGINKTLVFVETKRTADFIASYLSENNFPTTSIHGDRLQREREEALADFKSGRRGVLVATAVAARGLDIKNVAHVVNFDLPKSIDEYVHRIGRTGRVGNRGKATSFYNQEQDSPLARDLVKILKQDKRFQTSWSLTHLEEEEANTLEVLGAVTFVGLTAQRMKVVLEVGTRAEALRRLKKSGEAVMSVMREKLI
uniref:RNA helicase n=1 Tax=Timema douglasi TaxID=61478 RepID=A0A7R8VJL8_TIMDO|nr:unnamed protein product [Timema douglasi]